MMTARWDYRRHLGRCRAGGSVAAVADSIPAGACRWWLDGRGEAALNRRYSARMDLFFYSAIESRQQDVRTYLEGTLRTADLQPSDGFWISSWSDAFREPVVGRCATQLVLAVAATSTLGWPFCTRTNITSRLSELSSPQVMPVFLPPQAGEHFSKFSYVFEC
jgi:hypothetical protein